VFDWIKTGPRRKALRDDRRYLVYRTKRFLRNYLSADESHKQRSYEAVEGASAACRPTKDHFAEDAEVAAATAKVAFEVVMRRSEQRVDLEDEVAMFITDAYATVTMAYRRAAGTYTRDEELQKIGTAAVHLLTIATSYTTAQTSTEEA
jgi:hypothetical protein